MKVDSTNAQHPARSKAIRILEGLSELMGNEELFDSRWYEFEDFVTDILKDGFPTEVEVTI